MKSGLQSANDKCLRRSWRHRDDGVLRSLAAKAGREMRPGSGNCCGLSVFVETRGVTGLRRETRLAAAICSWRERRVAEGWRLWLRPCATAAVCLSARRNTRRNGYFIAAQMTVSFLGIQHDGVPAA